MRRERAAAILLGLAVLLIPAAVTYVMVAAVWATFR